MPGTEDRSGMVELRPGELRKGRGGSLIAELGWCWGGGRVLTADAARRLVTLKLLTADALVGSLFAGEAAADDNEAFRVDSAAAAAYQQPEAPAAAAHYDQQQQAHYEQWAAYYQQVRQWDMH